MFPAKKELLYVSAIIVLSFLCSFYPGMVFWMKESVNPMKDFKIKDAKLHSLGSIRSGDMDFVFKSGYCHYMEDGEDHSDFYQGNINQIKTSPYWRFPYSEMSSELYLESSENGVRSHLTIPYELDLPVVSVICDPEDFFSYKDGIYVEGYDADFIESGFFYSFPWNKPANYYRKDNDKRKVFFSFHDKMGVSQFATYAKAEISGKATRCFPQKSLRLSASKELGEKVFKYDFFGNGSELSSVVLRNGGNDNTKSLFRDMLMQNLMENSGVTVSGFIPCEVFLNGEYWGIHFLQNRMDENFIANLFRCKEKDVTIVENWQFDSGSEVEFQNLISVMDNLEKSNYKEIAEVFDLDDLSRYLVGQIFFVNLDWPGNNLKMYKVNQSKDSPGKWRFAFFDLDFGLGYPGANAGFEDMFSRLENGKDRFSRLFRKLMEFPDFKKLLRKEFYELLSKDLSFNHIEKEIDSLVKEFSVAIQRHSNRWGKPASVEEWLEEVSVLKDFNAKRNDILSSQIKKYLK